MDLESLTTQMLRQAEGIRALVEGVSDRQARWKPDADSWSILEVINHLVDEEREDFRARLDLVLHYPEKAWQSIDPERWVTERGYNQRGLDQSREAFLAVRKESISWLEGLASPDWAAAHEAPFGRIAAGDIMAAWVAHDLLHLRQLVELHWAYLKVRVEPYGVRYAGVW
jgi:hypothetical protein